MNTPILFRDYLANVVATSSNPTVLGGQINSFYFGLSRRIIEATRSEITYPALWAKVPTYFPKDNGAGNYTTALTTQIWIVTNKERDDYTGIDQAMDDMFVLARGLIMRIHQDANNSNGAWYFTLNDTAYPKLTPIEEVLTDHDFGYQIDLKIQNAGFYDICPI